MQKNKLLKFKNGIVRILETTEDKVLIIDCIKRAVPKWYEISENYKPKSYTLTAVLISDYYNRVEASETLTVIKT
jgi:phosphopantothenate synthetase